MPKKNAQMGIVVADFNTFIVEKLLKACLHGLKEGGITAGQITTVHVPGAFEIPLQAKKMALSKKYDVLIALGCVIKGETYHFDHVCRVCADGLMHVQLETQVPVVFEVLMVNKLEDALERAAESKENNRGYDAAKVALKLMELD